MFARAERQGVLPLLYQALLGFEGSLPPEDLLWLKRTYDTNVHKSMLVSRELIRIVEHLSAAGIEVMPYKGLALAETLYGDIALRQAGDIDLLIRPHDLPRLITTESEHDFESWRYFRFMMHLRERCRDRLRFGARLALTRD